MKELYRIACRDSDGVLRIVIVWRQRPFFWWLRRSNTAERGTIRYELPDGQAVKMIDERSFALPDGKIISREQ